MKKAIGRFIFLILGWKVAHGVPAEAQRSVMIAAPHTSNWDFFYVVVAFWILDIPLKVAIKNDWTKFPFGLVVKPLGGLGIDRNPDRIKTKGGSQVDQMSQFFKKNDRIALVIAPEGTRRLRENWKMGFYHVAKMADVPVTFGYLDYKNKVAGVGPKALFITDDMKADMRVVMDFYRDIEGAHPDWFTTDVRYS